MKARAKRGWRAIIVAGSFLTGKLAGATGTLTFEGIEDVSTGLFVEDVTGEICVDLAPR